MERDASHIPFVTTGSYPLRAGNAVRPLIDGEPTFCRICEAVEAARQSVWATIGSTNVANRSFYGDTEMNASIWHGPTVRALRAELLREHLCRDTSAQDDRVALRLHREMARRNAERWARGEALDGLAVALDPAHYGA